MIYVFKLVVIEKIEGNTLIGKIKSETIEINIDDDDKQIIEQELKEGNNVITIDNNNKILDDEELIDRISLEMNNEELAGIIDDDDE